MKSLDFFGKIVDQNGDPVVGAKIEGIASKATGILNDKDYKSHFTTTDKDGKFEFLGIHGVNLVTRPQKSGYEYSRQLPDSRPADYHPDPNNPVVFTMWKLKGPEPMKHTEFRARIPYDATTTLFDLFSGKKNSNGNLQITLLRNPLSVRRGKDHFDWTLKIEIPSGGLLPENDDYPNWASENGYQPFFLKAVNATDSPWQARFIQNFYFKDAVGHFGRLFVDVTTDSDTADTGMRIEAWINPSGSQNLEFDRSKQIR
jgi:hypothetical protein